MTSKHIKMHRSVYTLLATPPPALINCSPSIRPCFSKLHKLATPLSLQAHIKIPKRTLLGTTLPTKHSIMGRETIKMLVLETDTPHPETQQRRGNFGHVFKQLFEQAGDAHDPPLGVETDMHYVVEDGDDPGHVPTIDEIPDDVRAIIISGSMYDAHGKDPWILKLMHLLQELWKTRPSMRFSGVCFGHQILCRMLGSSVEPTSSGRWELAHTPLKLTDVGQQLFRTKDDIIHLHQMHQDQVTSVPSHETTSLLSPDDKVRVWASTDHTPVQGIYLQDRLFTSQGHLGFDEQMVHRQIEMRQESGGIKDDTHALEAKETAALLHDGVLVAAAILRLYHGEDRNLK
jgi:GMP synthase-like glutamine amidotransferase